MRYSRLGFWCTIVLASLILASLATGGDAQKKKVPRYTVPCFTGSITVDPSTGVSSHHQTRWICSGDVVQWDPNGQQFEAKFDQADCPFIDNCTSPYTNSSPKATVKDLSYLDGDIHTFKYSIRVNGGSPHEDPYVVGGGGH